MAGRELDPADVPTTDPWLVQSGAEPDTAMPSFEPGSNEQQGRRPYLIRQAWPMEPGGSLPLATGIQRFADARVMAAPPDLADTLLRFMISPELNREGIEPHPVGQTRGVGPARASHPTPRDRSVAVNCEAKELSLNGRRYGLIERPGDAAADIHTDVHRQMLYRDLESREWLDGSTLSGEVTVATAFNALCPGVDAEASYGLVYRDPRAQYPRALWGLWFSDPRICTNPCRNQYDYDEYVWSNISERTERSRDITGTLSAVRQAGRETWLIDATSPSQEEALNFSSMMYTMTSNGLETRTGEPKNNTQPTRWVRCTR